MKNTENKSDNQFPGYPHYNAEDDITSTNEKTDADISNLSSGGEGNLKPNPVEPEMEKIKLGKGENDISQEDLNMLGNMENDMDGGDDETLIPSVKMNDQLLGGDLDVAGNDFADEDLDPEDEENNLFSRGQD